MLSDGVNDRQLGSVGNAGVEFNTDLKHHGSLDVSHVDFFVRDETLHVCRFVFNHDFGKLGRQIYRDEIFDDDAFVRSYESGFYAQRFLAQSGNGNVVERQGFHDDVGVFRYLVVSYRAGIIIETVRISHGGRDVSVVIRPFRHLFFFFFGDQVFEILFGYRVVTQVNAHLFSLPDSASILLPASLLSSPEDRRCLFW